MRQYIDLVSDLQGNALFGATVTVTNFVGGALSSLFSDNGLTPITGSIVSTDITGQYQFFVADGDYVLTIKVAGSVYKTLTPVSIFDGAAQVTQADTGSAANLYATSSGVLEKQLRTGLRSWFLAAHTNTGASTYAYNGLTPKNIVAFDGSALTAGVIVTGGIYSVEYNGAAWQMTASFLTATSIGTQLYPPSAAEIANGVTIVSQFYPYNDFRRYGILPNDITKATTNTAILKQLWNPALTGPVGVFQLPIVTGADIWYFNANIAMRDYVYLDMNGQTMSWAFATVLADNGAGLLTAQRNVKIENGHITWVLTNASGTSNYGNGLMFGGRQSTPALFPPTYDSLLPAPMGNIVVRNVTLNGTADPTQARAIFMLGGLQNMTFDNINIEGNAALLDGHYYEFGFATNPTDVNSAQSSYMQNARYTNWVVDGCVNSAISGNGATDVMIDGLIATNVNFPIGWGIGEAAFMTPWNPNNVAGAKHGIHIKNVIFSPLVAGGTGITITGTSGTLAATATFRPQWLANHTYHNNGDVVFNGGNLYILTAGQGGNSASSGGPTGTGTGITDGALTWAYLNKQASTDLLDVIIEDCHSNAGNVGGYAVRLIGVTQARIRGCYFKGFQRGVDSDADSTRITIEDCVIRDCTGVGIALAGQGATGVYPSGRKSLHAIRNCWIAGSGTSAASAAISLTSVIGAIVEGNRFGYETGHDDVAETTQLFAVSIDAASFGVHVRNNYVAGVSAGNAYAAASGGTSRNNRLENNSGVQTAQGSWITDWTSGSPQAIGTGGTIAFGNLKYVRLTPAAAVTGVIIGVGTAIATDPAQEIVLINESIAANSITMAIAGTSAVANGVSCVIPGLTARRFVWDPATSLWYQQT
jgi:hypothetical protein